MSRPLNILVGGYIVGLPLAGMTWHHLHYLLGLERLGHRVTFLEDSGEWSYPYHPVTFASDPDPTYGIAYLKRCFARVGFGGRWAYVSRLVEPGKRMAFGMSDAELDDTFAAADLYVAVSGVTPRDDDRPAPRRTLGIDTDPVYTQLRMRSDADFDGYWRRFDRLASFGTRLGTAGCDVPTNGLAWHPTRQPVVLDRWPVTPPPPGAAWTTLGRWEHDTDRHVAFAGRKLLSSKAPGWAIAKDVPRSPGVGSMRLAMATMPDDAQAAYAEAGWGFDDSHRVSLGLDAYGDFIRGSRGEFTPCKQIYSDLASGWFSDRAACYLASGRPVVTQASGFASGPLALPTGEGLFEWTTTDEAIAALRATASDFGAHAAAARRVAEEHLDARRVLGDLVDFAIS